MRIAAVLCDIEGTITSLSFVQDVLFPLSHRCMQEFIEANWDGEDVDALRNEIYPLTKENVIQALRSWIESDLKHTILKSIQGKIWRQAFESGQIRGHVYPDVPAHFRKWKAAGIKIAIFSSGSVQAQDLLFRYSEAGDLTPYIDAYFDTTTGPKKETSSYERIAQLLGLEPTQILFLSDVVAELDAARDAGMQTTQLIRDGGASGIHPAALTFANLQELI